MRANSRNASMRMTGHASHLGVSAGGTERAMEWVQSALRITLAAAVDGLAADYCAGTQAGTRRQKRTAQYSS
jgi:hypothetical protein